MIDLVLNASLTFGPFPEKPLTRKLLNFVFFLKRMVIMVD